MSGPSTSAPLLYLAGASSEHERVCALATQLDRKGLVRIAFRWFDDAESWVGRDHELSQRKARELVRAEERAIRDAHIFWLLWPRELRPGAFIEYGYARAQRFHAHRSYSLVVSGEGCEASIFTVDADFRTRIDALALDVVHDLASKQHLPELITRRAWR